MILRRLSAILGLSLSYSISVTTEFSRCKKPGFSEKAGLLGHHWHMVVWPKRGANDQVSGFFRWLTVTHTQRWHVHYHTSGTGHLYQGRFKAFPVESAEHLYTVLRYVERKPVRANLVTGAETWR